MLLRAYSWLFNQGLLLSGYKGSNGVLGNESRFATCKQVSYLIGSLEHALYVNFHVLEMEFHALEMDKEDEEIQLCTHLAFKLNKKT